MFFRSQNTLMPTSKFQEPFYDSSCSELSDIPEVDEPSSPESTNENSPFKDTLKSLVNGISNLSNESSDFEEIYQRNLTQVRSMSWQLTQCLSGFGTLFCTLKLQKCVWGMIVGAVRVIDGKFGGGKSCVFRILALNSLYIYILPGNPSIYISPLANNIICAKFKKKIYL